MARFLAWFIIGAIVVGMLGFALTLILSAAVIWLLRPRRTVTRVRRTRSHRR